MYQLSPTHIFLDNVRKIHFNNISVSFAFPPIGMFLRFFLSLACHLVRHLTYVKTIS